MAIPSAAEKAIYDEASKECDQRVVVSLDYPVWSAKVEDLFSSSPVDQSLWWHTEPAPLISGGAALFRSFGGPPAEMLISRPLWFPLDNTLPHVFTINCRFPQTNPGYTQVIALGGLEGGRSKIADPLRIIQIGEDASTLGNAGDILVEGGFPGLEYSFANDQASHQYRFTLDPDAPTPFQAGSARNTIEVDATIRVEHTDPGESPSFIQYTNTVRPYFIVVGFIAEHDDAAQAALPGTLESPATLIEVQDITVDQLGAEGFEARVYPGWSSPNDGGDIDTAELGERFQMDGETWAKVPNAKQWKVDGGRSWQSDKFVVPLIASDPDDPDAIANIFKNNRLLNRVVLIDTRVLDDDGAATGWRRKICGIIEDVDTRHDDTGRLMVTLSGRDRPTVKLDTSLTRSFINAIGEIVAVNMEFTVPMMLTDIVAVGDASWDGDSLGATATNIHASPDMTPEALTTGQATLLAAFTQLCDELGLETFRRYSVSGEARYGQIVTALWTVGLGPAHDWQLQLPSGRDPEVDGYWQTGGASGFFNTADELRIGDSPAGTFHHIWSLFHLAELPQGATITDARLMMQALGAGGGVVLTTDVYFVASATPAFPTSQAEAEALALTSGVAWDFTASHADADWVLTPDLSAALQEVVDLSAWQAGNEIIVVVRTDTATGVVDFGSIGGPAADFETRLIVSFSNGARYVLRGQGSADPNDMRRIGLNENTRDGVGIVVVHADNMLQQEAIFSGGEPGPGDAPRAAYPARRRELHMSLAEGGSVEHPSLFATLPTLATENQRGHPRVGSVGAHRWRRENANLRTATVILHAHDAWEPTDEIGIDDPDHTGLVHTAETWVVNDVSTEFSDGAFSSLLSLVTQDVIKAVTRGL